MADYQSATQYTTFTDRAPEDWAEIWGERNFSCIQIPMNTAG